MNNSLRIRLASAATAAVVLLPMLASALSVDELQSQIKALFSQLQTLQQQLHEQVGSTTPGLMVGSTTRPAMGMRPVAHPCIAFARTLDIGASGDDVRQLQQQMIDDGDMDASTGATGFFGRLTAEAVHRMQTRFGIASTTGSVGPLTRQMLAKRCENRMEGMGSTTPGMMPRPEDDRSGPSRRASTTLPMMPSMQGPANQRGAGEGLGNGAGTVTAVDGSSLSFTDMAGNAKAVGITSTTVVRVWDASQKMMKTGSMADIVAGDMIVVHASKQSDGTFAAVLIQKGLPMPPQPQGPMMGGFMRGGDNY